MEGQYNMRNPAVKRLMKEAQELRDPTEQYYAQPLEDNLFEWHFTIRGPAETEFEGGVYHGRIILPPEYPMKPPSIILLTPQGRFELNTKICLSISGHHPESWRPSWSIRTALLAIIGFMPTHGGGAIGSLNYTADERKILARKSRDWACPQCGLVRHLLKPVTDASKEAEKEAKELASQINFQGEQHKNSESSPTSSPVAGSQEGSAEETNEPSEASLTDASPAVASSAAVSSDTANSAAASSSAAADQTPAFPPLPPGMTPEMLQNMARFMPPPHFMFPPPPPGSLWPTHTQITTLPIPMTPPTQTVDTPPPEENASQTTLRQRVTNDTATPGEQTPNQTVNAPQYVIRTEFDVVSFTIVLLCSLGIALIMLRRLGVLDMDSMRHFYDLL